MLFPPCFLLTSETGSTAFLYLHSLTSGSTTDSLLIFAEQDPGLPFLHPTGEVRWGLTTTQQWTVFPEGGQPSSSFSMTTRGGAGPAHMDRVSGWDRNSPHTSWSGRYCWLCSAQSTVKQMLTSSVHPQLSLLLPGLLSRPTPKPKLAFYFFPWVSLFPGLRGFLNPPASQRNGRQLYFLPFCLSPTSFPFGFLWWLFIVPSCCWSEGFHGRQGGRPRTAS